MFARRNLVVEDEDDNVTEATMMFNAKAREDLRKMAPTAAEKAGRPVVPGVPAMSSVKKKLSFDDTFTFDCPTLPASKSALAEKENEINVLNRQLRDYKARSAEYKESNEGLLSQIEALRADKSDLKRQILELEEDISTLQSCQTSILDVTQGDDWRNIASKYFIWYNTARDQLLQSEEILKTNNLWNSENKKKLMDAGQLKFSEFKNDDLDELTKGSVQDYNILQGLDEPDSTSCVEESIAFDCTQDSIPHSFMSKKSRMIDTPSPIKPEISMLEQSSIFNSTLYNTSVDFEKDEQLVRLENANNELSERLKLATCRAQKYLLVEEQKRGLEERNKALEEQLKDCLAELSAYKTAAANNIFELTEGTTHERSMVIADRMKSLQLKLNETIKEIEELNVEKENYRQGYNNLYNENQLLNETVSQQKQRIEQNEKVLREQRNLCEESTFQADQNKEKLEKCSQELQEAKHLVSIHEQTIVQLQQRNETMTDAGDSTQIFHMARNPLQDAHEAFRSVEERKRKADDTLCDESAKRFRDEEVEALKCRLAKSEHEKNHVESTLSEFAKKYRAMVTVLSGFQFKVKDIDEGICYVNSVYEGSENQFVFKYDYESQQVDLLDAGEQSNWNSQGHAWENEMRRYIGERQSVPAFLASVTLALESRRELPEEVERNHTFSVLQNMG